MKLLVYSLFFLFLFLPSFSWGLTPSARVTLRDYTTFAAAITDIGSSTKILAIDSPTTPSADVTIPSNVTLEFSGNGSLDCSNDANRLTVKGSIIAPLRQIFTNCGSGTMSFSGNRGIVEGFSEWWGADPSDSSEDTVPIRSAIAAIGATFPLTFSPGTYLCSGTSGSVPCFQVTTSGMTFRGTSAATIKMMDNVSNVVAIFLLGVNNAASGQARVSSTKFIGFTLDGNQANRASGGGTSGHCVWGYELQDTLIQEMTFQNCSGDGFDTTNGNSTPTQRVSNNRVYDSIFLSNNRHDLRIDGDHTKVERNYMYGNTSGANDCFHVEPTASVTLASDYFDIAIKGNTCVGHGGIQISGKGQNLVRHVTIESNYLEVHASSSQSAILCDSCYLAKASLNRINGGPSASGIPAMGMNKYGTLGALEGTHLDFYKNIVEGFYSCIKVKNENSDITIEGNECYNQTNFGIWIESSTSAITPRVRLLNNRVTGSVSTGYELRGLQDSEITGNDAIDIGGTNAFKCYQVGSSECTNVVFKNNRAYWATPTSKVGFLITTSSGTPTGINFDNNISNGATRAWDTIQTDSGFVQGLKSGVFIKNTTGATINSSLVVCIDTTAKQIVKCAATSGLKTVLGVVATEINNCPNGRGCPIVTQGQEIVSCTGTVNVGDMLQTSVTTTGMVEAQAAPQVGALIGKALTTCASSSLTAYLMK